MAGPAACQRRDRCSSSLPAMLCGGLSSQLTDEEAEARRGQVTGQRSLSWEPEERTQAWVCLTPKPGPFPRDCARADRGSSTKLMFLEGVLLRAVRMTPWSYLRASQCLSHR